MNILVKGSCVMMVIRHLSMSIPYKGSNFVCPLGLHFDLLLMVFSFHSWFLVVSCSIFLADFCRLDLCLMYLCVGKVFYFNLFFLNFFGSVVFAC